MALNAETAWPVPLAAPDGTGEAAITVLAGAAFLFFLYAYPLSAERWRARRSASHGAEPAAAGAVLLERISGAIVLGLGGFLLWESVFDAPPSWLGLPRPATTAIWLLGALVVVLPIVALSARKPAMGERYPEIRSRVWSPGLARASLASTAGYLFGYEIYFRGLLTFGLVELFGVWPGLSIMTALYVLAHLRKDANETFACLPMGYVFGIMALQTGSIWAVWLLHVALAWTTELITARRHPDIEHPF